MAEFTTAQGEYVWCAKTLELLCTELLQSEPTEVTVTLAAPDVNHPVSTCMYPGKVYEFLDADREGVGCSPPQLSKTKVGALKRATEDGGKIGDMCDPRASDDCYEIKCCQH